MSVAPTRSAWEIAAEYFDPPPDSDEDRALALRCAEDLRTLIREVWPILEPARPFVANWHIDVVCEHLMAVSAGELPRLIINVPPGSTKSTTVAVAWPAWEWLLRPHIRWIVASYAQNFAFRDSRKMRTLIRSRGGRTAGALFERRGYQGVLRLLGQTWQLAEDQDTKGRYDTTASGMRLATAVRGQATGDHADRLVIDDPLNPKQARSEIDRKRVNEWWDETMTTRFIDEHAAAVLVMQRLHENDLTGHLLAGDGEWHHLCLPAEYVPATQFTYPERAVLPSGREVAGDPRTEAGELLDPRRLSDATLDTRRRELGTYAFAGQFQQRPSPLEGGMFKRAWYVRRWHPGFDRYLRLGWDLVIQSWDMRFGDSKKASSSFVVGQVWGFHGADSYLLAQVRGRLSFTATLGAVRALTEFDPRATYKLVEGRANGPAVIDSLKREVTGFVVVEPEGGKDVRAAAVSPRSERGEVILPAADTIPCPDHYIEEVRDPEGRVIERIQHDLTPTTVADWIHEHATFPAGAHDDQVDAHSQALTWANPQPRPDEEPGPEPGPPRTIMGGILDEPM